jgi:hypothetical protein
MGRAASLLTLCFEESTMTQRNGPQQSTDPVPNAAPGNTLKRQFVANMELAGMGLAARKRYLFAVERLMQHYWCSPAELTEQQVHDYMLNRHRQDPAKTTFKVMFFALRLFFQQTLSRDWPLFKKK